MRVKRLAALTLCAAALSAQPAAAQDASPTALILNAAAVRLRATPSTNAAVVAQLALGTDVTLLERQTTGDWTRVRTANGAEGWIAGGLATAVAPGHRLGAIERIVQERLARQGDGFPACAELLAFVQRVAADLPDADTRARFAWHELRATSHTARAVPFITDRVMTTEPYASWLKARDGVVFYNEPGGVWMLNHSAFLAAYDRHKGTRAADDILWESVLNGLGGECETDVACHLGAIATLEGEYLRREPRGRHADAARERAFERLNMIAGWLEQPEMFAPARDCPDAKKALAPLYSVLVANEAPGRGRAIPTLDRIQSRCASFP